MAAGRTGKKGVSDKTYQSRGAPRYWEAKAVARRYTQNSLMTRGGITSVGHLQRATITRTYKNRFWILLVLFIAMYLSDLAFTLYGLEAGWLVEENPLIRAFFGHGTAVATCSS